METTIKANKWNDGSCTVWGIEVSEYAKQTGYIDYGMLAQAVGSMIICNNLLEKVYDDDLENGNYFTFYDEDGEEIDSEEYDKLQCMGKRVKEECKELYQAYIITDSGANFLINHTNEIVYYNNELDIYYWCITHCGTGWSHVETDLKLEMGGE